MFLLATKYVQILLKLQFLNPGILKVRLINLMERSIIYIIFIIKTKLHQVLKSTDETSAQWQCRVILASN